MPINYKDYPPNWKEIRTRILDRAGHRCERCEVPNHATIYRVSKEASSWILWPEGMASEALTLDGFKPTRIVLTIAHLDHDKENHDVIDDRLMALCQKCHLEYDLPRHVRNRKYGRSHRNQPKLF